MAEVPVNGKVLVWARTIRGLTLERAAELLEISAGELRDYESGIRKPLVGLLRSISAKYQINFTSLLMPEPLPLESRPTDHRAQANAKPLSIETLVAIEEVNEALDAFGDIASEIPRIVPTLRLGTATLDEEPEEVAARERRKFSVSMDDQRLWRDPAYARGQWRRQIEQRGIFTYMIPMPDDELSGFSTLRDGIAAICVNDRESTEGRKIFTLFHEYAHLLLRQTGISDENNSNHVERFCNSFAASFLVPRSAIMDAVSDKRVPYDFSDAEIRQLSTRFRVSNRAIAYRLEKLGLAPRGFYGRHAAPWDNPAPDKPFPKGKKINQIPIRIKRVGRLHAGTVLEAVDRQAINSFDASELIGLKPTSFGKLRAALK
jgi:Zn-dependent peptidase ImmA (M78 family)